jgi:hypothetical protein
MNEKKTLRGAFTSERPDYCAGNIAVEVPFPLGETATGTCRVEYTGTGFRPPFWVPNPLPALPVKATRINKDTNEYRLVAMTSWLHRPWEKIYDLVGLEVRFTLDKDARTLNGRYSVRGGLGMPKDAGTVTASW